MQISLKNINRIWYHVIYWVIFIFLYPIFYNTLFSGEIVNYLVQVKSVALGCFYIILATYFITYILIPRFLLKKKFFLFILIYLATFIVLIFIDIIFTKNIILPLLKTNSAFFDKFYLRPLSFNLILNTFAITHSEILIFIIVRFLINYIKHFFEKEKLKTKMVETELNMLKGQIHPHFLFNTLNNIYTLSIDGDNKKVSETIEKLSEILRYTIYECNNKLISLDKEVTIINNYIELEKLRYSNLKLETSFPDNVNHIYVIPLLFFTFVENAFKHGTSKSIKNKWLKIKLEIIKDEIHFIVRNSKSEVVQTDHLNYSQGIGLENAKKRLALCFGKENYSLEIKNENNYFEIFLKHKILNNENKMLNC